MDAHLEATVQAAISNLVLVLVMLCQVWASMDKRSRQ